MTDRHKLVLASGNAHKLEELRRILPELELEALGRDDAPAEDGDTYEANARIKARWGRRHAPPDAWALGEDSGIEVEALGGRPGIHSARWDAEPVTRLLTELRDGDDRGCRYRCVMVALSAAGDELVAEGELAGSVATEARGAGGFGYDPIVIPTGESLTVAELGDDWKARNSHRARAARALAELIVGSGEVRLAPTRS